MKLGTIADLREALGGRDENGKLKIGETFAIALKRAAGLTATRFDIDAAVRWLSKNGNFKISDVYPLRPHDARSRRGKKPDTSSRRQCHQRNPPSPGGAVFDKSGSLS